MLDVFLKEKRLEQDEAKMEGNIQKRFGRLYDVAESMRNFSLEGRYDEVLETREMIKESMKIINPFIEAGFADPRVQDLNNRLLSLIEASNNTFDNPVYAKEQKEIALDIMLKAMKFGALGKVDRSLKSSKDLFVETLKKSMENEGRIRKIKDHQFYPIYTFGLSSVKIDCDLDNIDKEVEVTLMYPMPNNEKGGKFEQKEFTFYISKDGGLFGEVGYDKVVLPKEISFIKLSEVMMEVSEEIERKSNTPFATVKRLVEAGEEEELSSGPEDVENSPGTGTATPDEERDPETVDPVREKILVSSAKKYNRKEIGIVVVKNEKRFLDGGTRFRNYRLYLFDVGIALLNSTVGNATYFTKYSKHQPVSDEQVMELRGIIDAHNMGQEEDVYDKRILDFILRNMDPGFFQEGVLKSELKDLPDVTRIIHNGDWQSRVEEIFK